MIRFMRFAGTLLIVLGAIVSLTWFIEPIRVLWPQLLQAFRAFPIAIQIGLVVAGVGFFILFTSILWERMEDRKKEEDLLED